MTHTINQTLGNAKELVDQFDHLTNGTKDAFRGVQISEVFFIYATLGKNIPQQIVESGRALGQSTYLLGKIYPNTPILSVERDPHHQDAPVAVERLKECPNVSCLFGDSRILLPEMTLKGDVIVIDGPKELRALKLALEILEKKQAAFIFIHDCYKGSLIRKFMEKHIPQAFYSDHPEFVANYAKLDRHQPAEFLEKWSDKNNFPTEQSYAGTFGCIPPTPNFPTISLKFQRSLARIKENILKTVGVKSNTNAPASS